MNKIAMLSLAISCSCLAGTPQVNNQPAPAKVEIKLSKEAQALLVISTPDLIKNPPQTKFSPEYMIYNIVNGSLLDSDKREDIIPFVDKRTPLYTHILSSDEACAKAKSEKKKLTTQSLHMIKKIPSDKPGQVIYIYISQRVRENGDILKMCQASIFNEKNVYMGPLPICDKYDSEIEEGANKLRWEIDDAYCAGLLKFAK